MNFAKELRKALASVTLGAMVFGIMPQVTHAGVEDFTDAAEIPAWADEAIEELMDMGVIGGNDDGSFAPNRQLNRAEVAKIIVLATGIDFDTTGGPHFPDVPQNAWFYDYVETMYNYGWINGYPDGFFRPGVGINRAEIAKMVVNAYEIEQDTMGAPHFDDVSESDWFFGHVETAYNYGLMRGYGDGTFGPANAVTRAETAKIVYDALLVVMDPVGPAEGTLEVVLSDYTPRGTNIPFNATSVPFTTVEMTASDDSDVELSAITFTRLGLGDNDDFDNVWMEVDGFKVGNDKSVNNDDLAELRFNPPLIIPAGQTIIADLVSSMDPFDSAGRLNTGHHNRFALVSADDLTTTAQNVVGDFPIEGEEMEIADYKVSEIDFSPLGTDATIDVGDNFIEIGKFRMTNDSESNKDIEMRAVTFKNDGTAELEDVLENAALYVSGEQVSAETIIDGDYITFRLDNGVTGGYIIEDGDSRIFSLRADIVSAEKDDTINFKIDNFEDVVGVEVGTSFGVKAISSDGLTLANGSTTSNSDCSSSAAEDNCGRLHLYTVDSGDLNVSRDPSSLGNQEYAAGSNDVVFMTARVVVDQPVLVDGVTVQVASGSNVADKSDTNTTANNIADYSEAFDNFRLYINDKLIDTTNDFRLSSGGTDGTATDLKLDFNTTFEIAGTSIIKLVGNIEDEAVNGDKVKFELLASDFDAPEYISTGDQITSDQLLGSATASFVEVQDSEVTIARIDGYSDGDEIVAGVDDVSALKFVVDNNDSGDVNTTSVTLGAYIGGADQCSNYTVAVFVDGTQQGSAKNLDGSSTTCSAEFNDISVVVASADQKEFTIVMDTIEASANGNTADTTIAAGSFTTTVTVATAANVADDSATTPATALASGTSISVGGTGTLMALKAGEQIVISDTGAITDGGAEVRTLASDFPINSATIVVTEGFSQTHNAESISKVSTTYTLTVANNEAKFAVADASNIKAGDQLTVANVTNTSPAFSGNRVCVVKSVSGSEVTCDTSATGNTIANGDVVTVGNDVDETTSSNAIRLFVSGVEADNVENGQTVKVLEGGVELGVGKTETATVAATTASCNDTSGNNAGAANNYLCGASFSLIESGTLTTSIESTVFSDIIVANKKDVEVLKVRFNASDDEVHVKDLYFANNVTSNADAEDRVDFKLYDANGQLVMTKQMVNGKLHFELANQDRIKVPKDDSTFVTVKVDARDITAANQTGARLQLKLDTSNTAIPQGIEAVTAATGSDLDADDTSVISGGASVVAENFVVYRSEVAVKHAATQPAFQDPSSASQEAYRFTVTADAARQIELGKLTFDVALQGMVFTSAGAGAVPTANDFAVRQVKTDGTIDSTSTVLTDTNNNGQFDAGEGVTLVSAPAATATSARIAFEFQNQKIAAGESRTYAVFVGNTFDNASTDSDDDSVAMTIVRDTGYATPATLNTLDGTTTAAATAAGTTTTINVGTTNAGNYVVGQPVTVSEAATPSTVTTTVTAVNTTTGVITFADALTADTAAADTIAYNSAIVWSDESASNHSDTTADWLNGYLVEIDTTAKVNQD